MPPRAGAPTLLANLEPGARVGIESRLPGATFREKDLRAMARAGGLETYRPNTHEVEQFREPNWLWIVLVMVRFAPLTGGEGRVGKHYVIVVDHVPGDLALVVADPHPWNPPVYCVDEPEFEAAWRGAKTKGPAWAAALFPVSREVRV
jgi:hypothetical protein